jgi:PAS domain S-box-containing protein
MYLHSSHPREWRSPAMTASVRPLSPILVSLGIFVVGLALTGGAVLGARTALQAEVQARFNAQADRLQAELDRRMVVVEQVLKSTLATVLVSPAMTSSEFRSYILEREIGRYFPGVRGIGLIETVMPTDLPGFVARQRAEGDPDFRVRAASQRGALRVVRFAEPAEANWSLVGKDLRADPVRHEAVQQALRSGRTVLSGLVTVDAAGREKGWMVLVPERVAQGQPTRLVFAALSVAQVMDNVTQALGPWAEFQLYDGEVADPQTLLFDSAAARPAAGAVDAAARYVRQSHLFLGDRLLTLRVAGRPALLMASGQQLPWIIAIGGALLSALLALAAWLYLSVQVRARRLAADMTADLGRMARVVERTSSAVFGLDLEGRITWANAGFERLTGLGAAECVGRPVTELAEISGVDAPSRRLLQGAIAGREGRRLELHNQMREGVRYWTDTELQPTRDSEGHINGFICIATDITRRKQAELRLRDNEHLMRVIADNLPAQVSYWDRDRCCRFVNRRFCEIFQRQPEQLTGHVLSAEIFGEEFFRFLLPHVERVLEGAPQYFECELRNERGQPSTWQVHYIPDIDAGEVLGFFVLALDVTDLRQARDVAVQASQAKSRFLSSMSHEIRTPLNAVMGMLALLRATPLDLRQRDYAEKADRAARSLLALLNDILDLAKIEAGKMTLSPRVFLLDDLLRDLSVIFAASVGRKDIEVLFEVDARLPRRLVADDLRLRQVLINLGACWRRRVSACGSRWACATAASACRARSRRASSAISSRRATPPAATTAVPAWAWASARSCWG